MLPPPQHSLFSLQLTIPLKAIVKTMSKSIESLAIYRINAGVSHYESGDIESAVIVFTEVLATFKHLVQFENIGEESEENRQNNDRTGPYFQPEFGTCEKLTSGCSDILIFLNPMKVPNMLPATRLHKILTLITMFNLAVCYHRSAIINNKIDVISLQKALQLYELAYAIQVQEGIDTTLTPTMIIMSNVGHIHKMLGDNESADQCFQHLLSTLMFVMEAGEKDTVWDFDGLFTNVLNTIYAHAPAAAA
jgi:tetratricopeptide (TPR) repeat protein